ncbi:ABC transporter permease [Thioclava sp. A2]|uniref:PhnE/PtxC family ABC transporter permease n=1 Tax=Thioclava sp. FCG-A2 TaxID=3080562 RepID=UPI00295462F2|nr:ABC transporter permease [Thioclava sp. A2]MDV7272269.1 ABC transporter permease [Thioclava sp. A2]
MRPEPLSRRALVLAMLALAVLALPFADLAVSAHAPWAALARMGQGLLHPDFAAIEDLGAATARTLAFALAGVAVGAVAGLICAPFYAFRPLRAVLIGLRSVHELFWALLLMQVTGLSPTTGVLAIALPYAGVFAKVFAELIEEADPAPARVLPPGVDAFSRFLFARAPLVAADMWSYILYRVECGLRSSAVLGFIGLPTLGFQLDSFFRIGNYGAVGAVLMIYIALVVTIRHWMRLALVPLWLVASLWVLGGVSTPPMGAGALWRFFTVDIVPAPLREGHWADLPDWLGPIVTGQILPATLITLIVAQLALVATGALAFGGFSVLVRQVAGFAVWPARFVTIVLRTIPEYMLAYLFLQILGPSMLPVILALAIHNGAIIAHLLSREAEGILAGLRPDAPRGAALWGYELAPRLFGRFLALSLYRWEMILRETAVMGLLGVATLGFYLDSALATLRLDRALMLILAIAALTAAIDALSKALRGRLGAASLSLVQNRSDTRISGVAPTSPAVTEMGANTQARACVPREMQEHLTSALSDRETRFGLQSLLRQSR